MHVFDSHGSNCQFWHQNARATRATVRKRRSEVLERPFAPHRPQVGREAPLGGFDEVFAGRREIGQAVRAKIAEVGAQPAPGAQRPGAAPEREAKRLDLAQAGLAGFVAIVDFAGRSRREAGR
jgi:hypothetical protein